MLAFRSFCPLSSVKLPGLEIFPIFLVLFQGAKKVEKLSDNMNDNRRTFGIKSPCCLDLFYSKDDCCAYLV